MRVYTNSLGITCIEPAEGCLLKKGNQTFKKVYLGKNDRAELYEEIKDASAKNPMLNASLFDSKDLGDNKTAISVRMPKISSSGNNKNTNIQEIQPHPSE